MFFGLVISVLGKVYTPPGEISEEITGRLLGTTDDERITKLQTKIARLTTKKNSKNFYKCTLDESSQ